MEEKYAPQLFTVALVGTGSALELFLKTFAKDSLPWPFCGMKVVGLVPLSANVPQITCPQFAYLPMYDDCSKLFASFPRLDIACDVSESGSGLAELRSRAPGCTTLITRRNVVRACKAVASMQQAGECVPVLHEMHSLFTSMIDQWDHEVLAIDAEGTIVNVNSRLVTNWGGSRDEYLGRNCFEMGRPELYGQNRRMLFEAALNAGGAITENFSCTTEEGHVCHYTVNAFPLRDEKNDIRRMILTRKDVTEQVRLEKRLRESLKMAAMGELATYAAHEILNPLLAIGGFAQQLLREPLADPIKEKLRIILEEACRLETICGSITAFAKPAGLAMDDVDVNLIAERTLEVMGFDCEERNISLRAMLSRDLPKVHANAGMLQQALVNIVKNAKEALQNGGLICVRTRYADAAVYLEVEDDGPGIPSEMQGRIFNPFFSTKEQGNGLGLALTKKILQEMDGTIYLHSRPGNTIISLALRPLFADADIRAGRSEIARAEMAPSLP